MYLTEKMDLPNFSRNDTGGNQQYSRLFGGGYAGVVNPDDIPSFACLIDALKHDVSFQAEYSRRLRPEVNYEDMMWLVNSQAEQVAPELVEKYLLAFPCQQFESHRFDSIYQRWEEVLFSETMNYELIIPLLLLSFESDENIITPTVAIERMNDRLQQLRASALEYDKHVHKWAAQSATHALIIRGLSHSRKERYKITGYPWELESDVTVHSPSD